MGNLQPLSDLRLGPRINDVVISIGMSTRDDDYTGSADIVVVSLDLAFSKAVYYASVLDTI